MKIIQKEDGSGEIYFSDEEIKVIQKHKKLILNKEFLKHFINLFIALFMEFQKKFDNKTKEMLTPVDKEIEISKPKDHL
jgi:deoxyribodipyrimidine photolyase